MSTRDSAPSPVGRVREALAPSGIGWIAIKSIALGRDVLFIRDDHVAVPAELASLSRYSLDELGRLLAAGATPEDLADLDRFKRLDPDAIVTTFNSERGEVEDIAREIRSRKALDDDTKHAPCTPAVASGLARD